MINVGIELSPSIDKKTGIGTYSYLLCQNLLKHNEHDIMYKHIYNFVLNKNRQQKFFYKKNNRNYVIRIPKRYYYKLYKFKIPLNLFTGKMDVLHITGLMKLYATKKVKIISTIHDIAFLKVKYLYSQKFIDYFNNVITYIINNSDLLLSSSYSTSKDLIENYKVSEKKIKTVYFDAHESFKKDYDDLEIQEFRSKNRLPHNYFLFVGTLEKRKNLINIIKGFSLFKEKDNLNYFLIIIGKGNINYLKNVCKEMNVEKYVIFTDYIDSSLMPYYFKCAKFLLYISFYEGFGIPILEAFSLSLPVITTNNSSMKELAADAGIYVTDPSDVNEISSVLKYAVNMSETEINSIKNRFPVILKKFDFFENSKKIVDIYKSI
jgi:glycosyltransferase involved in cell wall biosynthesis